MKKDVITRIVANLKKEDVEEVKVKGANENTPNALSYKMAKKSYTPDIVAQYKNRKDYFTVEDKFKKKNLPDLISKWILFALMARRNGGKFYLFVQKEHFKFIESIVKQKHLSLELIRIK
ncbi:MAG: hypothetical protein ABJG68_02605 [Crocinitomicaceae bacterium]